MKRITKLFVVLLMILAGITCRKQDSNPGPVSVSVVSDMKCKGADLLKTIGQGSDSTCILYNCEGDSVLVLKHINAGFNCCPENFTVGNELKGDSLIITEDDVKHGCKCNCLFDLDIRIRNLPKGAYHIRIVESYAGKALSPLIFDVDLAVKPSGQYCVTRPEGWWR